MDSRTAASLWQGVRETSEVIEQSTGRFDNIAESDIDELHVAEEALSVLAGASDKLGKLLDVLATHYDDPTRQEPADVHIALDQAAAAAEDLAACARATVRTIEGAE